MNNIEKILEGDFEILNKEAEEFGKKYAPQNEKEKKTKLSTSQIRNILDDVQRMGAEDIKSGRYLLLRAKLAYVSGKNKESEGLRELKEIFDKLLQNINYDYKKFGYFRDFFEAIVSYHKFYSKVKD
jgi:CRISPR-associated protein Csm2